MRDSRCTTSSGPFACSKPAAHQDECECTAPSAPWVGPALLPIDAARAAAQRDRLHAVRIVELQRALHASTAKMHALAFEAREEDRNGSA
jgi:hypothetical protein